MLYANNYIGRIAKIPVNMPKEGTSTKAPILLLSNLDKQSVITKTKAFLAKHSSRIMTLSSKNSSSMTIRITKEILGGYGNGVGTYERVF